MGATTNLLRIILAMLALHRAFCERGLIGQGEGSLQTEDLPDAHPGTSEKVTVRSFQFTALGGLEGDFKICEPNREVFDAHPTIKWHPTSLKNIPWLDAQAELGEYQYSFVDRTFFARSPTGADAEANLGWCYRFVESAENLQHPPVRCLCGDLHVKGKWPHMKDDVAEHLRTKGCSEPANLAEAMDGVGTQLSINGVPHEIGWQHPRTFLVEVKEGSWCKMDVDYDSWSKGQDSSVAHAMPYCMMLEWSEQRRMQITARLVAEGKTWSGVPLHLYATALFDHQHSNGWFASSQIRYKASWKHLAENFDTLLSAAPYLEALDGNHGADTPALDNVMDAGKYLCKQIYNSNKEAFKETKHVFQRYMNDLKKQNSEEHTIFGHSISRASSPVAQPKGRKPLFLIVGGPPSSGKSLASMSPKDFELIQNMTSQGAFGDRSWEDLQSTIVELNVDRIVEASDLMQSTKGALLTEHRWVEALGIDDREVTKRQASEQQRQYWFLRKKAGIDDLSNAYIQFNLAMGHDVIYETLLGDGWLSWAKEFELPKARAAGYQIVLINYVVPVEDLIMRAVKREQATGQTAAPAKQIENDAVAAPTNFMNPDLLDNLDYAISMTHVKFGQDYEDPLVVYRKDGSDGCFTHCAESGLLERVDAKVLQRCYMAMCG